MLRIVTSTAAARRLDAARRFILAFPASTEILIVSASRGAADDFARTIAHVRGASFGLHRFSVSQLAARAAAGHLAASGRLPATRLAGEALAARATFEAVRDRALVYFAPVAGMPGFPRAVARTVDELRQAGVAMPGVARSGLGGSDLAELVTRFVDQCDAGSASDRAALFGAATAACRDGVIPWPRNAPLLLLDVPVESSVERTFVTALVDGGAAVLATVPDGDAATLEGLLEAGGRIEVEDDDAAADTDLGRLRAHLFGAEPPVERDASGDVEIFSGPGEGRESVEIARRVLAEARRGVRFDEIAVFLRSPQEYAGLLEHAFARAGVSAYFDRGTRRPDPSGRAFVALLTCAVEKLSAKRFDEYLSLGQVPAAASGAYDTVALPDDDVFEGPEGAVEAVAVEDDAGSQPSDEDAIVSGSLRAPWKWEELIVESAVIGGRERWQRRLNGLKYDYETRIAELEKDEPESPRIRHFRRDLRNLEHLRAFALPIIDTLDGWWDEPEAWGVWLERFGALAPRVLKQPMRVLRVLADLRPMAAIGPVAIEEVRDVVAQRLLLLDREAPARRYGAVFVGSPHQARGRVFKTVFVPGLAERMFPQRLREDPLLLDEARVGLGAGLVTQDQRAKTERLLLKLAVGAATERVFVSYPRLQVADSRARVPSFYLLDVARAIRGSLPDHQRLQTQAAEAGGANLAWPAPADPSRAIDDLEHDLAVLRALFDTRDRDSVKGRAHYLLLLNESLRRSVIARWERSKPAWRPSDGLVRVTDRTRGPLAAQRLTARPYSLSALQRFAWCPYQFLLSAVFRLEPWDEPEPLQRMNPLTRGSIFHAMQAEFFRALKREGALPVTSSGVGHALGVLDAVVAREADRAREELAPAIDRVWDDEIEEMRQDLRVWVERQATTPAWRPEYFEFSFGLSDAGRDERSVPDPVPVGDGFLLRGSVDLIEQHENGSLRVTDHKTGKNRTNPLLVIDGGRVLQPVLYSAAVSRALGRPVSAGRLSFCTTAGGFTEHPIAITDDAVQAGLEALAVVDRAVEAGFLAAAPAEGACRWCDFVAVCGPRVEDRIRKKAGDRLMDLETLRSRP